jgi:hypothetical protein
MRWAYRGRRKEGEREREREGGRVGGREEGREGRRDGREVRQHAVDSGIFAKGMTRHFLPSSPPSLPPFPPRPTAAHPTSLRRIRPSLSINCGTERKVRACPSRRQVRMTEAMKAWVFRREPRREGGRT